LELTEIVELGWGHFVVKIMETRLFSFELLDDLGDFAGSSDGLP